MVTIWGKRGCPYCTAALELLRDTVAAPEQVDYRILDKEGSPAEYVLWVARLKQAVAETAPEHKTFPWIWIGDKFVGGWSEVSKMSAGGRLEATLEANGVSTRGFADDENF